MRTAVVRPTRELIEGKEIVEGQHYDFKRELELDRRSDGGPKDGKVRFIDDVVAFLNSGLGYLIVGVVEKDGAWDGYRPLHEPRDALKTRLLNIVLDNIDPPPKIDVQFIELDEGYILYIEIPAQKLQPYTNKIACSFHERIGSRNRPMSRGEVQARFKSSEDMERDLSDLFRSDSQIWSTQEHFRREAERDRYSGWRPPGRSRLQIGILPRQHYDRSALRYDPLQRARPEAPSFFGGGLPALRANRDGFDAFLGTPKNITEKLSVSTDWYVSTMVVNPIEIDRFGRVGLQELAERLKRYLASLGGFLGEYGIIGPFCIQMEVEGLNTSDILSRFFNDVDAVCDGRPRLVEALDEHDCVDDFHRRLRSAASR